MGVADDETHTGNHLLHGDAHGVYGGCRTEGRGGGGHGGESGKGQRAQVTMTSYSSVKNRAGIQNAGIQICAMDSHKVLRPLPYPFSKNALYRTHFQKRKKREAKINIRWHLNLT